MKHGRNSRNNRGASLISVIIAMTVVAVLGVTIMYVAYSNLNMKVVDRKSKDNFYTAEGVLDEVVAGLQSEMSEEYARAYTTIMENYGNYSSVTEMSSDFKTEFILDLVSALHQHAGKDDDNNNVEENDSLYSIPLLRSFVTSASRYAGTWSLTSDGTNLLETLSDGLVLRNVKVTYVSDNYQNTIITDIKLSVPGLQFALISSMPKISDFAYIADDGMEVGGALTLNVNGNAYSGITTESKTAVSLTPGSTLDASGSELFVAGGDVIMTGAASLVTSDITSFWMNSLDAGKSATEATTAENDIRLLGRTYVADDITLNGSDNVLTLAGQYFGYCSGKTEVRNAAESSAIIVNGKNTTLDLADLDTLVIAGTAYVSGSSVDSGDTNNPNSDVKTGDSIAVKSNQIAYLVPAECEGIPSNPMTSAQYSKLIANTNWQTAALETQLSSINRSIASYGTVVITPVFSTEQGGCVYLFLNFNDVSAAANYFMDMYESNSTTGQKLRSYMDNYLAAFSFNVNEGGAETNLTRLVTNGNFLLPGKFDYATLQWTEDPTYTSPVNTTGNISNELSSYAASYAALCSKLVTSASGLTTEEKNKTVYENLIDDANIVNFFASGEMSNGAVLTGNASDANRYATFTASSGVQAIIANGDYMVGNGGGKGIILARGNVTVGGNWEGVIICGGKLTVAASSTLKSDEDATGEALRLHCDTDAGSYVVTNFFKGGENYSIGSSSGPDTTDVRNCVNFENWKSE